jgi:PmbA protein
MGSSAIDGEGVARQERTWVDKGTLQGYILSSYSARKLDTVTTGNAGGVRNFSIAPGDQNFEQLLQTMGTGLLVTEMMGGGGNIMTGDYSRGASGFWVENGEIVHPVEEITVAGNMAEMFMDIAAVGNDVYLPTTIRTGSILLNKMTVAAG